MARHRAPTHVFSEEEEEGDEEVDRGPNVLSRTGVHLPDPVICILIIRCDHLNCLYASGGMRQ